MKRRCRRGRGQASRVADLAEAGIDVEAELGEIGGKEGVHAPGVRTKPDGARAFVEATGVDALAVAEATHRLVRTHLSYSSTTF